MALSSTEFCTPSTFNPSLYGAEILSLQANLVTNYSASVPEAFRYTSPSVELKNATFCNITVTYTHPGQNDSIITEAWLPEEWNERFMAVGGGGWVAGRFFLSYNAMNGAIADGYATITTDSGLGSASEPGPWALNSPGNVNLYNLQNLASVSLNDEAEIGKSLIKSFYGKGPKFSYWAGCSQGGRQGLMLAQRYPDVYDGIVAGAPAIHFSKLATFIQWPHQVMNELEEFPYGCEVDAITAAAISSCDGLDGITDGVISNVDECLKTFDASSLVGKQITCAQKNGTKVLITEATARIVNATWHGHVTANDERSYHGILPGADLTGNSPRSYGQPGVVTTDCDESGCKSAPNYLATSWFSLFVAKNASLDLTHLTRKEFDLLAHAGFQEFASLIETSDSDLRRFRDAGGKMVTFHGLADNVIPPGGTRDYYEAVGKITPDVHDFYRLFEAPGLGHCFGGASGTPTSLFEQLRGWVENGTAPEKTPVKVSVGNSTHDRILCSYPAIPHFSQTCGYASRASCWSCSDPLPHTKADREHTAALAQATFHLAT